MDSYDMSDKKRAIIATTWDYLLKTECALKEYSDGEQRVFVNLVEDADMSANQLVATFKLKVTETTLGASSVIETKSPLVNGTDLRIAEKNLTVLIGETPADTRRFDITYQDTDGSVLFVDEDILSGQTTHLSSTITKDGYILNGWLINNKSYKPGDAIEVKSDIVAIADWKASAKYTLSFDSKGGSFVQAVSAFAGETVQLSQKPTRSGYTFDGWYTNSSYTGTPITRIVLTDNTTIYAKWSKESTGGGGGGSTAINKTRIYTKDIFGNEHPTHIGYINGYLDGSVKPEGDITREEITSILYRITNHQYEKPFVATGDTFFDVKVGRWSAHDIEYMTDKGIVYGYPDGEFKPSRNLSRAEFAALIFRFTGIEKANIQDPFTDLEETHWAYNEILDLTNSGLIEGYPDKTYKPENNITRAEVMTVINKLLGRKPLESYVKSLKFNPYNDLHEDKWYYVTVLEATITHNYWLDSKGYEYKWEDWK